jgi:hydrogenase nickel incorporation protein HypA/HybF
MHELTLCRSIGSIVREHAGDRRVQVVHLEVGQLRQVVPGTLVRCWSIVNEGTVCEGSVLDVEHVPAELTCDDCGARTTMEELRIACGGCGGTNVRVTAGEELLVTSIELVGAG